MNTSKISWKILNGVINRHFKIYSVANGKTRKSKTSEGNVEQKVRKLEGQVKYDNKKLAKKSDKAVDELKGDLKKAGSNVDKALKDAERNAVKVPKKENLAAQRSESKTGKKSERASSTIEDDSKKKASKWKTSTQKVESKAKQAEDDKADSGQDYKCQGTTDELEVHQGTGDSKESSSKQSKVAKEKKSGKSNETKAPAVKECLKFDGKLVGTCKTTKFSKKPVRDETDPCPKIAILGAGMAGLTAAWRLQQAGLTNFTVYEANKRIGGRISSAWSGDGINEYGAEWIEGDANPVLRLAYQEGLTMCRDNPKSEIYMTSKGNPVPRAFIDESKANWKKVIDEGVKTYCSNSEDTFFDYSLLDFIKTQKTKFKWKGEEAKVLFESMSYGCSCRLGGPSNELSLNDLGAKFRYETRYGINEGVIAVLAPMLKEIPESKIKLNHRVQIIQWDECPVKLIFDDCCEETADIVLVTFSLGVLKNDTELFEPELPPDKIDAIENTGFATVNKIFLDYADPFWLKGDASLYLSREIDHEVSNWTDAIYQVREICGGDNTLEISLCGQPAEEVEQFCEEEVARKITQILRQFTGVAITPYPIALTKTCWLKDPLFMGSVSFMGKNTNRRHLRALGLPIPLLSAVPSILFAGDHTACGEIGTLKGARMSGFREAQRIIEIIDHLGWPPKQRNNSNNQLVKT